MKSLSLLFIFAFSSTVSAQTPLHTYLYWTNEDLGHTMTIALHTPLTAPTAFAHFSTTKSVTIKNAQKISPTETKCYQELNRCVHRFSLKNLIPHATYYFILSDGKDIYGHEKKFRTLAEDPDLVTMVSGGDLSVTPETKILLTKAAAFSPDLVVLGGDLAYDNGDLKNLGLWDTWLNNWEETMVTPEGYTIPMILAIGNHEVKGGWNARPGDATMYLKFFQQQGDQTYFLRKIGKLAVLMILDTGHITSVEEQAPWILKNLVEYKHLPYRFAAYHVPLYPSHRKYEEGESPKLRKFWGPAFDQGLTFALEHHDHSLKRTHLIKAEKRDDKNGVLYLGDGCFGVSPRDVHTDSWYLAKSLAAAHFWVTKLTRANVRMEAIALDGKILDSAEIKNLKH